MKDLWLPWLEMVSQKAREEMEEEKTVVNLERQHRLFLSLFFFHFGQMKLVI